MASSESGTNTWQAGNFLLWPQPSTAGYTPQTLHSPPIHLIVYEYFHPPAYITGRLLTQPASSFIHDSLLKRLQYSTRQTSSYVCNTWHNYDFDFSLHCGGAQYTQQTNFPGDSGTFMKLDNPRDGNCLHIIIVLAKSATLNGTKCFGYDLWLEIYNFHKTILLRKLNYCSHSHNSSQNRKYDADPECQNFFWGFVHNFSHIFI